MMNDKNQNTSAPEVRRILPVMLKVENLHIHLDERSTSNTYFNGVENQDEEPDIDIEARTKIFYCDPMASWQKPKVEKNHEFIRYIIPKGKSMAFLTEEKVVLLMNHINSIRRESLGGRSPWQVASEDEDMRVLMNLLNMKEIEPDNVLLTPDLLED